MDQGDPYDLNRFVQAQAPLYDVALGELRSGRKRSHWMWFVFPQFAGLGVSAMSAHYAVKSAAEAVAYLSHPVLGPRLIECCDAAIDVQERSAFEIFGSPDDMKLRSCVTLFAHVSPPGSVFERVLARYFPEGADPRTLGLVAQRP
jgi:uncharacterized protein (DUF1810 family)